MSVWFWYFLIYSFLGYCLEKLFAWATRAQKQVRKCFLLLPLCPVYGLSMAAALFLLPQNGSFLLIMAAGGLICTIVEYLVHLFYDRAFAVQFWSYTGLPGNLRGRVCPQFSLAWGLLCAAALRWVQPFVAGMAAAIPGAVTFSIWILLVIDALLTGALLRKHRNTELLTIPAVIAQTRSINQSNTSR